MVKEYIDKRVLRILRWSLVLQIVILFQTTASPGFFRLSQGNQTPPINWFSLIPIGLVVLIFVLLSLKKVQSRITKPALLVILYTIALLTILARNLNMTGGFGGVHGGLPKAAPSPIFNMFRGGWETIFFIIIPLVFIAWQYSMREVVFFSLAAILFETIPSIIYLPKDGFNVFFVLNLFSDIMRSFIMVIVGWIQNQLVKVQREQHEQLIDANKKLRNFALTSEKLAQTQERNRLARELHDTLAHTLSSVSVQLEATKALFDRNPNGAKEMLDETLINTKNGLKETRRTLVDLRASELESYGLTQAIRNIGSSSAERGGFDIQFNLDKGLDMLPDDISHSLYRTVQEALENTLRHANASHVSINMFSSSDSIQLEIRDDGQGFNIEKISNLNLGIRGMRERIEMLGGEFTISSNPQTGTEIIVLMERRYD